MNEKLNEQQIRDIFQQEENDWQIVKQASINGDQQATKALELLGVISDLMDSLDIRYEIANAPGDLETILDRVLECNKIAERMADLIKQRRAILYEDYGILAKRKQILAETIQRQQSGYSSGNIPQN
jgi:hypothetical protein